MKRGARVTRLLQIVATLGLLALLSWQLDIGEAWTHLSHAAPGWVLAAITVLVIQTVLAALRWQVTARVFGLTIGARVALKEYFLAQIVNQSLPGSVLGDVGRAVRASRRASLMRAGQSVVVERLWGQIALFVVMLVAVTAVTTTPGGLALPEILVSSVAVAALAAASLVLAMAVAPALPGQAGRAAGRLARVARRGLLSRAWTRQASLSLGTVAANLLAFALCARATGTVLPMPVVLTLVPVILFTMVVPLTVSGWGLREGAAAALFPLAGASPEAGLAASVTFGLVFLVSSLPGLAVLLLDRADSADAPGTRPARPGFDTSAVATAPRNSRL